MKVYELLIDEDGNVDYVVYENVIDYFNNVGVYSGVLVEDGVEVNEFEFENEWIGDSEENRKCFYENSEKMMKIKEKNKNYKMFNFSVEYDVSWVLMDENDYKEFCIMSSEFIENYVD